MLDNVVASHLLGGAIGIAITLAYALVLLGWGSLFRRLIRLPFGPAAVDIGLGLATLIFLGGVLNLARIAVPASLAAVAAIGAVLSGWRMVQTRRQPAENGRAPWIAVWIVAICAMIFVALTTVPPTALNWGDDFQKYLVHPVRMLETGTLFGSPLNALGHDTIGGQAFAQAFIIAVAPLPYINAFDALFCFGLCIVLVGTLCGRSPKLTPVAAAAAFAVACIEPQYVNISSLYSGSALILTLIAILSNPSELSQSTIGQRAAVTGVLVAALVALKLTFALIATVIVMAGAIGIWAGSTKIRPAFNWIVLTGVAAAFVIGPWVALYAPYLLASSANSIVQWQPPTEEYHPFSNATLFWGASWLAYTTAFAIAAFAAILNLLGFHRLSIPERSGAATLATTSVLVFACYLVVVPLIAPAVGGYQTSLRYFTPIIAALLPATLALGCELFRRAKVIKSELLVALVYTGIGIASIALFFPSLKTRVLQAIEFGNVLAFRTLATHPDYITYNTRTFAPDGIAAQRAIQNLIPAGATILAWTARPFLLDYSRNQIYDVNPGGLNAPWAAIPDVQFVIWEHQGPTVESPTVMEARTLSFFQAMRGAASRSWPLYNHGGTIVFAVETGTSPDWRIQFRSEERVKK